MLAGERVVWATEDRRRTLSVESAVAHGPRALLLRVKDPGKGRTHSLAALAASPVRAAAIRTVESTRREMPDGRPAVISGRVYSGPPEGPLLRLPGRAMARGLDLDGAALAVVESGSFGTRVVVEDAPGAPRSVVATRRGRVEIGRVRLAGRYVAWDEVRRDSFWIVVYDRVAGAEAYRVRLPVIFFPEEADFDVQADGKLALIYGSPTRDYDEAAALGWASPAEPFRHRLPIRPESYLFRLEGERVVRMEADRIAFVRKWRPERPEPLLFQVVATDLSGGHRPLTAPMGGASYYGIWGFDYDGTRVAWSLSGALRCIYASPLPLAAPAPPQPSTCDAGRAVLGDSQPKTWTGRSVAVPVRCAAVVPGRCEGRIAVSWRPRRKRGPRRNVRLGSKPFSVPNGGVRAVRFTLPGSLRRRLRQEHIVSYFFARLESRTGGHPPTSGTKRFSIILCRGIPDC